MKADHPLSIGRANFLCRAPSSKLPVRLHSMEFPSETGMSKEAVGAILKKLETGNILI